MRRAVQLHDPSSQAATSACMWRSLLHDGWSQPLKASPGQHELGTLNCASCFMPTPVAAHHTDTRCSAQADCELALGLDEEHAHGLGRTLKAIEAVTPGSDLHCILAAQLHGAAVQLHGPASKEAAAALSQARQVHTARYGELPNGVADQLIHLNSTLYT